MAVAVIAGPLEDARGDWPPRWPLSAVPDPGDETDLCALIKDLALDRQGYNQLVTEAYELTASRPYERLHAAISHWLETHRSADAATLHRLKAIAEEAGVQHKLLDVVDTEVQEGMMVALASTWEVDKVKDRVLPGAYAEAVATIKSGDYLPLVWQHARLAGKLRGRDRRRQRNGQGLEATARFDLDDADGRKAYKLVKRGSIKSLSIGYRVLQERHAAGGITELVKVELHEVSLVLSPANPGARILAIKSDDNLDHVREWRSTTRKYIDAADADALRQKSERIAREHAPVRLATFDA